MYHKSYSIAKIKFYIAKVAIVERKLTFSMEKCVFWRSKNVVLQAENQALLLQIFKSTLHEHSRNHSYSLSHEMNMCDRFLVFLLLLFFVFFDGYLPLLIFIKG